METETTMKQKLDAEKSISKSKSWTPVKTSSQVKLDPDKSVTESQCQSSFLTSEYSRFTSPKRRLYVSSSSTPCPKKLDSGNIAGKFTLIISLILCIWRNFFKSHPIEIFLF